MSRWVSSRSGQIEEQRYNMIHGEHGMFATGEGSTVDIPQAHRDTIAKDANRIAGTVRAQAATQGPKTQGKLNAAADKIDQAANHIRDGNHDAVAKALIKQATTEIDKAGYPGMSEMVKRVGTDFSVAHLTPTPHYEAEYGPDTFGLGGNSTVG